MGACEPKRDQRLNLSRLTEVILEHCKKLRFFLNLFFVWPVQVWEQAKNNEPTNQKKQSEIINSEIMMNDVSLPGLAVVVAFKNISICQEWSDVWGGQIQFGFEFRANEMLALNGFFCLL